MESMNRKQVLVIKMMLENLGHPEPNNFLTRGYFLTKLRNDSNKTHIGYMSIPLEIYDDFLISPDKDTVEDVTDIAIKMDLLLYSDGLGTEDINKWWCEQAGKKYSARGFELASAKVSSILNTVSDDEDIEDAYEEAVNDTNDYKTTFDTALTNQIAYFKNSLINKLGE